MRALLGNLGQYGDLVINTVLARAFKERYPDSHVTMQIAQKFAGIAPLFLNHPIIDDILVLDGYDNYPTKEDIIKIQNGNYDFVFNGMPKAFPYWYNLVYHQTQAICIANCLIPPQNLQCVLNPYFDIHKHEKTVALALFSGQAKTTSLERANAIAKFIHSLGYKTLHLNGPNEPDITDTTKANCDYFTSVKNLLGCDLLVSIDTGMAWVASAYNFPVVGLYGKIYPNIFTQKAYEPVNPMAIYLERNVANDIPLEEIYSAIKNKLTIL